MRWIDEWTLTANICSYLSKKCLNEKEEEREGKWEHKPILCMTAANINQYFRAPWRRFIIWWWMLQETVLKSGAGYWRWLLLLVIVRDVTIKNWKLCIAVCTKTSKTCAEFFPIPNNFMLIFINEIPANVEITW